jgi:hypothetical protein
MAQFPRARGQGTEPKAKDPMMKRVDMDHGEIGSRPSGMPSSMDNDRLSLSHVGSSDKQGS